MWSLLTSSAIELLLLLGDKGEYRGFRLLKSDLNWSQAKLFAAIRNLELLKLVEVETLREVPPVNVYRLTDKGWKVYEMLKQIEAVLKT